MEIGTMVSNKVYYIKYDTEPRQFAMDMPIVQNITESFRIGIHWLFEHKILIIGRDSEVQEPCSMFIPKTYFDIF